MTPFEFMANAFYIGVGAICLSIAALIVCGVSIGIYNAIKRWKKGK